MYFTPGSLMCKHIAVIVYFPSIMSLIFVLAHAELKEKKRFHNVSIHEQVYWSVVYHTSTLVFNVVTFQVAIFKLFKLWKLSWPREKQWSWEPLQDADQTSSGRLRTGQQEVTETSSMNGAFVLCWAHFGQNMVSSSWLCSAINKSRIAA